MRILLLCLLVTSCGLMKPTRVVEETFSDEIHEKLMSNGHWDLSLYSHMNCADKIRNDEGAPKGVDVNDPELTKRCGEIFKSRIVERANTLCAGEPSKLYGCNVNNEAEAPIGQSLKLVLSCYSKCGK